MGTFLALQVLHLRLCVRCARCSKGGRQDACAGCKAWQAGRIGPEAGDPVRHVRARRPAPRSAGALRQRRWEGYRV